MESNRGEDNCCSTADSTASDAVTYLTMFDHIKTLLFTFTIYTKTNYRVYYFQDDEGHDHRVDDRRAGTDRLHRQLMRIAVQQALGADRGEDPGGERPHRPPRPCTATTSRASS